MDVTFTPSGIDGYLAALADIISGQAAVRANDFDACPNHAA